MSTTIIKTAKPVFCYAIYPTNGKVVKIYRDIDGYFPARQPVALSPETYVRIINNVLGVSQEQEEAMVIGSMFGWHCPGAQPAYDVIRPEV